MNILNVYPSLHLFYPRCISCSYLHESWKCWGAKLRYPILSHEKFHESINQSCISLRCSTINFQKAFTKKTWDSCFRCFHTQTWNHMKRVRIYQKPILALFSKCAKLHVRQVCAMEPKKWLGVCSIPHLRSLLRSPKHPHGVTSKNSTKFT